MSSLVRLHRSCIGPLTIALLFTISSSAGLAQLAAFNPLPEEEILDLERTPGLRYDIDFLVNHAQAHHAGPTRPAFSPEFLDEAAQLKARVGELTDLEVLTGLMRLLAILNDGHTGIYGPDPDTPLTIAGGRLPLRFYWFEEGLYLIDGQDGSDEHAGSRVLSMGGLTPEQLMQHIAPLRGRDNEMTPMWMAPQFFLPDITTLMAIGATRSPDSVALRLETGDGSVHEVTVAAGDYPLIRKLRPSPAASNPVPLYLQHVDRNFWLTTLDTPRTLYLQFNQVRDSEDLSLAGLAGQLGQQLNARDIRYLILDVRHNNGGNNTLLRPLVQRLIAFDQASGRNRLFVITGRNTFSAAQNFINRVERWTDALFVGEPSASSPNFVGEESPFTLPWSRISGSLSDLYWQDSDPWDERQWIEPDIPVAVTAADYFSNRDAALEAVLAEIDSLAAQTD